MSHLTYSSHPAAGEDALKESSYSQAVILPPGPTIHISGQGGWDPITKAISSDLEEEFDQAFQNVNSVLNHASEGAGSTQDAMSQVYKITFYYTSAFDEDLMRLAVSGVRKWFPDHKPLVTGVGVRSLALPGMRVEIEAAAHLKG